MAAVRLSNAPHDVQPQTCCPGGVVLPGDLDRLGVERLGQTVDARSPRQPRPVVTDTQRDVTRLIRLNLPLVHPQFQAAAGVAQGVVGQIGDGAFQHGGVYAGSPLSGHPELYARTALLEPASHPFQQRPQVGVGGRQAHVFALEAVGVGHLLHQPQQPGVLGQQVLAQGLPFQLRQGPGREGADQVTGGD